MLTISKTSSTDVISKEDYIAIETRGEELVIYFKTDEDINALIKSMQSVNHEDAERIVAAADPCSRFSKRECDKAGGCCNWVTSGGFNFCKCI